MRSFFLFILIVINSQILFARQNDTLIVVPTDTLWDTGGDININFSQVSLSNWAGGGQSSISLGNILNLYANFDDNKNLWNSKLQATYGLIKQGREKGLRKSDDLFLLESQYGRNFSTNWMASALVNFRSQFYKGEETKTLADNSDSTYLVSEIFSPAYLQIALGFTYKKNKSFIFTLSPVTGKYTIVMNDKLGSIYGLKEGENVRSEIGTSFNANFKKDILKNIRFETNLNLFSNYRQAKNVDVNWSTHLVLKVHKYITSSVITQLIYDDDIDVPRNDKESPGPATQFKSAINIGFALSF